MKKKIVDFIKKIFKKSIVTAVGGKVPTANLTGTSGLKIKTGKLEETTEKKKRIARKIRRKKK